MFAILFARDLLREGAAEMPPRLTRPAEEPATNAFTARMRVLHCV